MVEKYHGNKGLEYYKAYPRDFFEGTIGMNGNLRGFYRMIIDLIYMHDGFLLNDWGHISGLTGFGKTQSRRMMSDLVSMGKIDVSGKNGEYFTQKRAKNELKASRKFQENQANKSSKRWNNSGLPEASGMPKGIPPQDHKTTRPQDKESSNELLLVCDPNPDQVSDGVSYFNEVAKRVGWPIVQKISETRKAALKNRFSDVGGLGNWCEAVDRAALSPLLTGDNNRGWVADFDWLSKPKNFTKLMEGNYDPRTRKETKLGDLSLADEIADAARSR